MSNLLLYKALGLEYGANKLMQLATVLKIDQRQLIDELSHEDQSRLLGWDELWQGLDCVKRFYIYYEGPDPKTRRFTLIKFWDCDLLDYSIIDANPDHFCYRAYFKINTLNPNNTANEVIFDFDLSLTGEGIKWMAYG